MGLPATALVDDFNRANENPLSGGGAWVGQLIAAGFTNSIQLVSSTQATGRAVNTPEAMYRTESVGPDCEVYCTVPTVPASGINYVVLAVRYDPVAHNCYFVQARQNDKWFIFRCDGGTSNVQLATTAASETLSANDQLVLRAKGSVLSLYKNGALILSATDSTYSGAGHLGLGCRDTTTRLDDFGGGTLTASLIYSDRRVARNHLLRR